METINQLTVRIDQDQLDNALDRAVAKAFSSQSASYFNKKEASKYLKISAVTLWTYQEKGLITPVLVGEREMFTKAELDRFAAGKKITPNT